MEGTQKVKMDFPLVKTISRDKLIEWFRETMSPKLHTIKELGTGADFCLGLELLFPGCIGKHRIKIDNPSVYDRRQNFKLLQSAFNSLKLNKDIPIEKLEEGNYRETYYFALWFKAFFESNYKGTTNGLRKFQSPSVSLKNGARKAAAGGFRQSVSGCWQLKDVDEESSNELRQSIPSEKETTVVKSPPQRKKKPTVVAPKIINPRMPNFSRVEQESQKSVKRTETAEKPKAKSLPSDELRKSTKNVGGERKKIFEESKADFEKTSENVEPVKINKNNPDVIEIKEAANLAEIVKVAECLEDIKEEDEDEEKSMEELDLKKDDMEIELEQIHQVVREQRRIIDELEQQKESKGEQISTLESIVCELTQAIKELEIVKQNQASQLKDLQESTNAQSKPMEEMEQIMNEQLKTLEDLTQTKEEHMKKIADLEHTNNDLGLNNTMLTKSNKAMAVHIEDLEQNYRDLTQQNDNLTKCNQELACHYSDLSNENRDLHQRNKRLAKNYETILCYSCLDANLYFKQLVKIEKACKREPNNSLRKCINTILNQTKYHPPLAPGSGSRKEHR